MSSKEVIKTFLIKYKIVFIGAFVIFCIFNFIKGWNDAEELPKCNNTELINKRLPDLVNNYLVKNDASIINPKTTISEVDESFYDEKAGLRQCSGALTMRAGSDIETYDFIYQIAWTDKEKSEYQYKIIDIDI
ncbi:TPA: hypothetical protein ACSTJY_004590 [Serratia fonticola]|uniref:hypothetical protein n=1 Tax=Serratia fonticola TaxID=47917 RepID=UPI0034C6760B